MLPHSHFAHWIGTIGELLNFTGALVLALDLFFRQGEHAEARDLNRLAKWGRSHGISATYKKVSVADLEFTEKVQGRRASLLGYWGIGFLALGFLSLMGYHLVAIYQGEWYLHVIK